MNVRVYNESGFAGYAAYTDAQGQATLALPAGNYRFRVAKGQAEFWSGADYNCTVPGCTSASITTTVPVVVTVADTGGQPLAGLTVRAYNGTTDTGFSGTTNADGQVTMTLPAGNYRFKVYRYDPALYSTEFWSGTGNHCALPGCTSASITTSLPVVVTVRDLTAQPQSGVTVQVYNGTTYLGYSGTTDANGQIKFILPTGSYRFKAYRYSRAFFSGETNHCTVSGCAAVDITLDNIVVVTVLDTEGNPEVGIQVKAYTDSTYTGFYGNTDAQGQAILVLPAGNYRFRVAKNGTTEFWSGAANHCAVPGCTGASITTMVPVVVTVADTGGQPLAGLTVRAYSGTASTGYSGTTNADGQVTMTLPAGNYRFKAYRYDPALYSTEFWSGTENHCVLPGCTSASITTSLPVVITVRDLTAQPQSGVAVQVYNGTTYLGYSGTTDANGQIKFILPTGSYRFKAYRYSRAFFSGETNHCTVSGCAAVDITLDNIVVVTVLDSIGNPEVGVQIKAYTGSTYTGFYGVTDSQGQAILVLPVGNYRFRFMKNGTTEFWSGVEDHCTIPGCTTAGITTDGGTAWKPDPKGTGLCSVFGPFGRIDQWRLVSFAFRRL